MWYTENEGKQKKIWESRTYWWKLRCLKVRWRWFRQDFDDQASLKPHDEPLLEREAESHMLEWEAETARFWEFEKNYNSGKFCK